MSSRCPAPRGPLMQQESRPKTPARATTPIAICAPVEGRVRCRGHSGGERPLQEAHHHRHAPLTPTGTPAMRPSEMVGFMTLLVAWCAAIVERSPLRIAVSMRHHDAVLCCRLDAFFCSCEEGAGPSWRTWPFCVGGSPTGRGGATANYAARAFGVGRPAVGRGPPSLSQLMFLPPTSPTIARCHAPSCRAGRLSPAVEQNRHRWVSRRARGRDPRTSPCACNGRCARRRV